MMQLHAYWRSSASYRVRCALNLKGLAYDIVPVHIARGEGEQHAPDYRALNPQELVPTLVIDGAAYTQSLVILQLLEERYPEPALAPIERDARARMWAFCQYLACEIQPLQNLRVLNYLTGTLGLDEAAKLAWLHHWLPLGLAALEASLRQEPERAFAYGDAPSYAECCLVPQAYACERYGVALTDTPRLAGIIERARALPAFEQAHPQAQPDAQA